MICFAPNEEYLKLWALARAMEMAKVYRRSKGEPNKITMGHIAALMDVFQYDGHEPLQAWAKKEAALYEERFIESDNLYYQGYSSEMREIARSEVGQSVSPPAYQSQLLREQGVKIPEGAMAL